MNERELRLRVRDLEAERDDLRSALTEQARCIADQQRQIVELRAAVDVLLQPAPSELLAKNMAHPSRGK
jgi:hypothetical protein